MKETMIAFTFVLCIIGYLATNLLSEGNLFSEIFNLLSISTLMGVYISIFLVIGTLKIKRKNLITIAVWICISTIFFYSVAYTQEIAFGYDFKIVRSK